MLKKIGEKSFVQQLAALIGYIVIMLACKSLRLVVKGVDVVKECQKTGAVLLLWHQSLLVPIYSCRGMGLVPIIASSRDGELIARLVRLMGYDTVRGSTGKADGISALRTMLRLIRDKKVIPVTPDGPLGPPHTIHMGSVAVMKKTGCPFIACGCAMSDPVVLEKSWDRHQLPRLFDRAAVIYEEPAYLPEGLSDEEAADYLTKAIDAANAKAAEMLKESE